MNKRWFTPAAGAALATALGVAINLATDLRSNLLAWLTVVVLTIAGFTVGRGADAARRTGSAAPTPRPDSRDSQQAAHTGKDGLTIQAGRDVTLGNLNYGRTVLAVGTVVTLGAVAGLLVGATISGNPEGASPQRLDGPPPTSTVNPLAAVVNFAPKNDCESGWVVADNGESQIPISTKPQEAILASGGAVTVTIQGLIDQAVVLHDLSVEVVARHSPLPGIFLQSGCGSDLQSRFFQVDLDAHQPDVTAEAGTVDFPYKVSGPDPEQLIVTPELTEGYVEWRLHVRWSAGATMGELVIDDGGKPLRTTAITKTRKFCVAQPNSDRWVPAASEVSC